MAVVVRVMLLIGVLAGVVVNAAAQDVRLGGGSDIPAGSILPLPRGARVPAVHHVFADNPESRPIEVEFRAEAPPGIEVTPDAATLTVDPGESVKDPFTLAVDTAMAPGDYETTVQLVRSDVRPRPGQVTNIPAVGTTFTVRVTGEAATAEVAAVSEQTGAPVEGTLTLAAVSEAGPGLEVARAVGSELRARVAPGTYEAGYLFEGRLLASERVTVAGGETASVRLQVETISFVLVDARPVEEAGRVVVAELVASVENHLGARGGPVTIQSAVHRDGKRVDTAVLEEREGLPVGVTEARLTYRPAEGFPDGDYRFVFELTTEEFTVRAATEPAFRVGGDAFPVTAAALAGLGAIGAAGAAWILARRIGRMRSIRAARGTRSAGRARGSARRR